MTLTMPEFDRRVRQHVYEVTLGRGYPPTLAEAAASLDVPVSNIREACERLAQAHMLVLQRGSREILMASPFSAVPTTFRVELEAFSCFGNCIWDALGIPAMLRTDAWIETICPDCDASLSLSILNGALQPSEGIVHFALPARRWWEDIVFS